MSYSPGRPIIEETSKASPSIVSVDDNNYSPPPMSQMDRRSERIRRNLQKAGKKFLVFMISHVGLTCLVVAYSIMGGFIFRQLEAGVEISNIRYIGKIRKDYVKQLWDYTEAFNILYKENWTYQAEDILREFQMSVYQEVKKGGWDGSDRVVEEVKEWTYAGALLYSVTIITTIGYGHLTPKTDAGRVVTMLYALIGIPLTLLCLTNIGSFMAKCFRLFWKQLQCRRCQVRRSASRGHILKRNSEREKSSMCEKDVIVQSQDAGENKNVVEVNDQKIKIKDSIVRIPISVCLFLVVGYIFMGAMLFTLWEKDWNFLEGSYFCFITLSTIGFGDYVPGHSHTSWHDQAKRVSCTLYLLFGLALLAMCFDLIQSEVREICRGIGIALGFSKQAPQKV